MMEVKFGLNTKCFVIRTPPLHSAQDGFQNMLMWYPYIQNQLTVKETEAKNIILIQKQISKYLQPIYITFWIKFQPVFIFLSVFFFYRVFTDLRNTQQQQQTVYLSICLLMYIPAAWPGFEEFLRGLYILCMSFLPDRAHIRCITTTCLRIINKCNLKGEKGWYIYAWGRYALRIRRKIPEISMFHSYI